MLSAAAAEAVENNTATGEHALHAKARAVMFYRRACELGEAQGCKIYRNSVEGLKVCECTRACICVLQEMGDRLLSYL